MQKKISGFVLFIKQNRLFVVFLIFVSLLYFKNLTHDIYGGDVGDIVTASYHLGIAHPPGYPLFISLGYIASHLPLNLEIVTKVSIISLLSSLGSLVLYYLITKLFIKNKYLLTLSTSVLAFSYLFWLYTEIPEVFALNIFLCLLIIYFTLKFYLKKKLEYLYLLSLFFGIALTNHQTTILLSIPVLFLLFPQIKKIFLKKQFFISILLFFLGLSIYLLEPIYAFRKPIINWDNPVTIQGLLRLVLRQDYGTFSGGTFPTALGFGKLLILKNYAVGLVSSISFPAFVISLIGIIYAFKKNRRFAIFLILAILLAGPVFISYVSFPIVNVFIIGVAERFYLLSSVLLLLFLPFGFEIIYFFFRNLFSQKIYATVIFLAFLIIPFSLLKANIYKTDLSNVDIGTQYGKDNLKNLDKNALFFVFGDTKSFNIWYVRHVLNYRTDVGVVNAALTGVVDPVFMHQLTTHMKNKNADPGEALAENIINEVNKRSVYSTDRMNLETKDYVWVPRGLVFQLYKKDKVPSKEEYITLIKKDLEKIKLPYRKDLTIPERSATISQIPLYYAYPLSTIGAFIYDTYQDKETALYYQKESSKVDPDFSAPHSEMAKIYLADRNCPDAEQEIGKAIALTPTEHNYYLFLYLVEVDCNKDKSKVAKVEKLYYDQFGISILQDIQSTIDKNK